MSFFSHQRRARAVDSSSTVGRDDDRFDPFESAEKSPVSPVSPRLSPLANRVDTSFHEKPTRVFPTPGSMRRRWLSTAASSASSSSEVDVIIGIELHARLISNSKLFSGASAGSLQTAPNTRVSLVDLGFPGALPRRVNSHAVDQAIKTGLALKGEIQTVSEFERKHYTYSDQPLGYQITQHKRPIVKGGSLTLRGGDGRVVRIEQMQLEQDTGKTVVSPYASKTDSLIDFNRAGMALLEIVSAPDMRTPREASDYMREMRAILRAIGTCDGEMESGSLRADVNISIQDPRTQRPLSQRVEIKNLNSTRSMERAIQYETQRLREIHEANPRRTTLPPNETRGYSPKQLATFPLRAKESATDYRYLPEPDLPRLIVDSERIERLRSEMSELPEETRRRMAQTFAMTPTQVDSILEAPFINDPELLKIFVRVVGLSKPHESVQREVFKWITFCLGMARRHGGLLGLKPEQTPLLKDSSEALALLVEKVSANELLPSHAKNLLEQRAMKNAPLTVKDVTSALTSAVEDTSLDQIIQDALTQNPKPLQTYLETGKQELVPFFIGQVMRRTKGKANPDKARAAILRKLEELRAKKASS